MIRIRVRPQYGAMGYGGLGGYGVGGYGALALSKLEEQKKLSALQLAYERALFQEKLKTVQMQSALKYGAVGSMYSPMAYGAQSYNPYGGYGGYAGAYGGYGVSSYNPALSSIGMLADGLF